MLSASVSGLKTSTNPSDDEQKLRREVDDREQDVRFAASWMPTMLSATRTTTTAIPTTMSHGFCFSGSQKIER